MNEEELAEWLFQFDVVTVDGEWSEVDHIGGGAGAAFWVERHGVRWVPIRSLCGRKVYSSEGAFDRSDFERPDMCKTCKRALGARRDQEERHVALLRD